MKIQSTIPVAQARAATRPPVDTQEPGAEPLRDRLDFETIDTPEEASQLPILDPAYQLALAGGLALTLGQSSPGYIAVDSTLVSQGSVFDQSLVVRPQENGQLAFGGGPVENRYWSLTRYSLESGGLLYNESFGNNDLSLTIRRLSDGARMSGHLGEIEVSLESAIDTGPGGPTLITSGQVGSREYEVVSKFEDGELVSEGFLGGDTIKKRYRVTQETLNGAKVTHFSGRGTNASYDQTVNVTLQHLKETE